MHTNLLQERLLLTPRLGDALQHRRDDLVVPGVDPGELRGLHRDRRAHQRAIDLLSHARLFAVVERGADAVRHLDAGRVVRHRGVDVGRHVALHLRFAGHQPGHRLHHQVVAAALGQRALAPKGGVLAVDQPRVDGAQRFVVDPQLLCYTGPVVQHHNIGILDHAVDGRLRFRPGHVHGHPAFAAVEACERPRFLRHELNE